MHERHRRSLRLAGYDYSRSGAYFVTICVEDRLCLFGDVDRGSMRANAAGKTIQYWWDRLPSRFPNMSCEAVIVMPNHLHGVLLLRQEPTPGGTDEAPIPLGTIMQWFKTMTTNAYLRGVKNDDWPPFNRRLWQRNYYERIIRNNQELDRICSYIESNPSCWAMDSENPANPRP